MHKQATQAGLRTIMGRSKSAKIAQSGDEELLFLSLTPILPLLIRLHLNGPVLRRPLDKTSRRIVHAVYVGSLDGANLVPIGAFQGRKAKIGVIEHDSRKIGSTKVGSGKIAVVHLSTLKRCVLKIALPKIC